MQHRPILPEAIEHYKEAYRFEQQNHFPEAIAALRTVAQLDPGFVGVWRRLGYLLMETQNWEEACDAYERALRLQSTHLISIQSLSIVYQKLNRVAEAESLLKEAIRNCDIDPPSSRLYHSLANVLWRQKRWEEVESNLRSALLADPDSIISYHSLMIFYLMRERLPEALAVCTRILKIEPNYWDAYLGIIEVLEKTDKKAEAHALYQKVAAIKSEEDKVKQRWDGVFGDIQRDVGISSDQFTPFR